MLYKFTGQRFPRKGNSLFSLCKTVSKRSIVHTWTVTAIDHSGVQIVHIKIGQSMTKQCIFRKRKKLKDWSLVISAGHSCKTLRAIERRCPIFSPQKSLSVLRIFPSRQAQLAPETHICRVCTFASDLPCSFEMTDTSSVLNISPRSLTLYAVWIRLLFAFATRIFHDSQALVTKGRTWP